MTHFTVGIILHKRELSRAAAFAEQQMTPYCEHLEVEPYVCYSLEQARSDIDRDIHRLEQIIGRRDPAYNLEKCREDLDGLRRKTPRERFGEYIRFHTTFDAKGAPISTYNPRSKWDWYVIGGRWDGWINGRETSYERVDDNIAPTEQVIRTGLVPHALVTPDGQWHEHGQLGWWAVLITENEDWDAQAKALLGRYPGHHVLVLDAHI